MNLISLCRVEFIRLIKSKMFWAAAALCACSLLPGYFELPAFFASIRVDPTTMNGVYMGNPLMSGTFFGSLIWAAFAVYESDRVHRSGVDTIAEAVTSPVRTAFARLLSLAALAAAVCALCALVHLPYIYNKLDYLFDPGLYIRSFLILPLPTWVISFTLAAALYQITRRVEITALIFAALVMMSFNEIVSGDYFARWINPIVLEYSDGFSSNYYLRIAAYTRLLWLFLAGGVWFLSAVCLRKYQKGLIGSFLRGIRTVAYPITAVVFIACGAALWVCQPIVNHGSAEFVYDDPIEMSSAVITHSSHDLKPDVFWGSYYGTTELTVTKEENGGVPEVIKLNSGYKVESITLNGQPLAFTTSDVDINDYRKTSFVLPAGEDQALIIKYGGFPQELRCYTPGGWNQEINPESIELSAASCAPSINCQRIEPVQYDIRVTLPDDLTPMANGQFLADYTRNPDGTRTWTDTNEYNFAELTAAHYTVENLDSAGVNIDFIYSGVYESMVAENDVYARLDETLEYCIDKFGRIDWMETEDDSDVMMLQTRSVSGAMPGRVDIGESVFNTISYDGGPRGDRAAETFAHEIIHQWWGGMGATIESDFELWSAEGLTVYTTYRLMKEKYGELYAKQYYEDRWQAAVDANNRSFYNRHPEIMESLPEIYSSRINGGNRTINEYYRMPLMILKAERLVGGEERMDEILRDLFENHSGENYGTFMTYQNFLDACGLEAEDLIL